MAFTCTDRFQFLNQFHPLERSDYQLLEEKLRHRQFKKGDHLLTPGQVQKELFLITTGVQILSLPTDKRNHVLAFTYSPNVVAVPEAFTAQKPSRFYLSAITNTEADTLSFADLQLLFDQAPSIDRLFRKMTESVLAGVLDRYVELRTTSIEERFKLFSRRSPHLLQLVPHKYIAAYLDIDPTNFSKLFNTVRF